ncbi:hypothetical protein [Accumulibacter sp.]|uniref:hypothetical protein n=1 Tax=Accumulibacter sp. TaxID=2053492 RepID=UPI001AC7A9D6|nr:hypothetical protein [Accumulibacter sp.]MBN8454271.1 hypothetical protein [Accumulibacter sp.]MBO3706589.1 hypothetical protein [Candidatus Accumulibacter conexus]
MSNTPSLTPVMVERAAEQLRQEKETFDQQKKQEHLWFILRLSMGFASIVLLGAVMIISTYILFKNADFPKDVVTAAGAALFVDVLGLLIGVVTSRPIRASPSRAIPG